MWDTIWKNHKAYIELQLKILQFTWNSFLNSFLLQSFTELFFIGLNSTLASKCASASICRPISFQLTGDVDDVDRRTAPARVFQFYVKLHLTRGRKSILCRISCRFQIWPPFWPLRSHISSQPLSFWGFLRTYISWTLAPLKNPLVFEAFDIIFRIFLPYQKLKTNPMTADSVT